MKKDLFIFLLFAIMLLHEINADIISLNSGGTGNIILNPNEYIEGFFSGEVCIPYACVSLGYNCGNWSDGCGSTLSCGSCGTGYTCTSGTCVSTTPEEEREGGAGGAGGNISIDVSVIPTEINLNMIINTNIQQVIKVTNNQNTTSNVAITQVGLDGMVLINEPTIILEPFQSRNVNLVFVAPSTSGNFVGNIIIGDEKVSVSLNIKTKLLLFDSSIIVLNKDSKVEQGDSLKTEITLIPLGDKERLDVTLEYSIKDYNNKVYYTKTETMLVNDKINFKRNFQTSNLPPGKYLISLILKYSNGIAPSSAYFEVTEKTTSSIYGKLIFILIIFIIILFIAIIIILIYRRKKKEEEKEEEELETEENLNE